jgi:uncharacterized protein YuzE
MTLTTDMIAPHPRGEVYALTREPMKIAYSPDADILTIQLREGKPVDSRDIAEGIIIHLSARGQPLEIEVLDASKVIQKKDVEISIEALFTHV